MMPHNVNNNGLITKFSGSTPVRRARCSKSPAKIRTNLICSEITIHWPHFCRWQLRPMFIQWRMASAESHNYVRQACRP